MQNLLEVRLDAIDRRILEALQTDGRLSNVDLANRIGLSPSPCLRRVRQLESAGLIKGYGAHLSRRRLGLGVMAFVQVQLDRHEDARVGEFEQAVSSVREIVACYAVTGAYDFLLQVVARDLDAFGDLAMKVLLRLPGVKDIHSSLALHTLKDGSALPLDHLTDG